MDDKTNLKFAWKNNDDEEQHGCHSKNCSPHPNPILIFNSIKITLLEFLEMEFWSICVMKVYLKLIQLLSNNYTRAVVYFDQSLGSVYPNCWSKNAFSTVFTEKS